MRPEPVVRGTENPPGFGAAPMHQYRLRAQRLTLKRWLSAMGCSAPETVATRSNPAFSATRSEARFPIIV
jgi:hypothetical protein